MYSASYFMKAKTLLFLLSFSALDAMEKRPYAPQNHSKAIRNFTISIGNSLMAFAAFTETNPYVRLGAATIGATITASTFAYTTEQNAYEKIWGNLKKILRKTNRFIREDVVGDSPYFNRPCTQSWHMSEEQLLQKYWQEIKRKSDERKQMLAEICSFFTKIIN